MHNLKSKDIQEILNVSRTTLFRLEKKGLPHTGINRAKRYNLEDVLLWVKVNGEGLHSISILHNSHIKERANGFCDLCEEKPRFNDREGNPYLKIYEMDDEFDDSVALCSSCFDKMKVLNMSEDKKVLTEKVNYYKSLHDDYVAKNKIR